MTRFVEVDPTTRAASDKVQMTARRLLIAAMRERRLTEAQLSARANRQRTALHMMMSPGKQITLTTLSQFLAAADYELNLVAVPLNGVGPVLE